MKKTVKIFLVLLTVLSINTFANPFKQFQNLKGKELEYAKENWIEVPQKYQKSGKDIKLSFIIKPAVQPDTQSGIECSACSAAFLMRWYGEEADGIKMYHSDDFPCKFELGAYPKVFKKYLEPKGYTVKYFTGSFEDLLDCVSKGTPVIVLLLYPGGALHYVPVVGFDKKYIFIQDSVPKYRNCDEVLYNERRTYSEFKKMWNVPIDYCSNLFITVTK